MTTEAGNTEGSQVLASTWNSYRDWAAFARERKRSLMFWRKLALGLGLGGAVLETLAASDFAQWTVSEVNVFGLVGFIMLAVAAFLARSVLGGQPEQVWVGARSAAEALKSESYKYCTRVPPYDGDDRDRRLASKKKQIGAATGSLPLVPDPEKRSSATPPVEGMGPDEYISTRLHSQIDLTDGFYWKAARQNTTKTKRFRDAAVGLGVISAVLGGFGTLGVGDVAIWVAVVTTLSSSLAAYFQAGRFEFLALSYSATARRLQDLVDGWKANPDPKLAAPFILGCEEAMSAENQAWLAEWLR